MRKKKCSKCNCEKDISCFASSKKGDGYDYWCKECHKDYQIEYRDKLLAYYKAYHKKNKAKRNLQANEYYSKNKDEIRMDIDKEAHKEYMRIYRKLPKYKKMASHYDKKRRARKNNAVCRITFEEMNNLIASANNICFWCDKEIPNGEMNIDHIYPLSKGGGHTISNLCVSCRDCNQKKYNKDPEEWVEEIVSKSTNQ